MIKKIEQQISDILRCNKELSNQIDKNQQKKEQYLDDIFLDVIDILDAFQREESIIVEKGWNESEDSKKAIKRLLNAKKKVCTMLEKYKVTKIEFPDGTSKDDYCSVTDTEPEPSKPNGTILSIEKEGYLREDHILRRAGVIIVKN